MFVVGWAGLGAGGFGGTAGLGFEVAESRIIVSTPGSCGIAGVGLDCV